MARADSAGKPSRRHRPQRPSPTCIHHLPHTCLKSCQQRTRPAPSTAWYDGSMQLGSRPLQNTKQGRSSVGAVYHLARLRGPQGRMDADRSNPNSLSLVMCVAIAWNFYSVLHVLHEGVCSLSSLLVIPLNTNS